MQGRVERLYSPRPRTAQQRGEDGGRRTRRGGPPRSGGPSSRSKSAGSPPSTSPCLGSPSLARFGWGAAPELTRWRRKDRQLGTWRRTTTVRSATSDGPDEQSTMAAIVRSSARKTILRAFSSEGTFSVGLLQSGARLFMTTSTGEAGGSNVNQSEVDQMIKKVDGIATKAILVEYTRSLAQEQKTEVASPHLRGFALPSIITTSSIGFFMAGYWMGFEQIAEDGSH